MDALAWLGILALIGLAFWALMRDNARARQRTAQEFERDVAEQRESLLRAGMLELDKFVGDAKAKRAAVEYVEDEKSGRTRAGGNREKEGHEDDSQ